MLVNLSLATALAACFCCEGRPEDGPADAVQPHQRLAVSSRNSYMCSYIPGLLRLLLQLSLCTTLISSCSYSCPYMSARRSGNMHTHHSAERYSIPSPRFSRRGWSW